jgi:hypothetical protein
MDKRWQDRRRDSAAAAEAVVTLRFNWADAAAPHDPFAVEC